VAIFKDYKIHLFGLTVFFTLVFIGWRYIEFIKDERETLEKKSYLSQDSNMKKRVSAMILAKQKATLGMALSLVNDKELIEHITHNKIPNKYYKNLVNNFRKNTLYKNIWIQIIDENLISIYRSWSDKKGDSLKGLRGDLVEVFKTKKVSYSISSGKFDLTIKAIVPILKDEDVIGVLEIISHFNSISKEMKKFDVDSVVVLEKKYTKNVKYPFTNIFIDEYYVANFDAPLYLREELKEHGIQNHFSSQYMIDKGKIATSYELKSINGETLGWYIMFKKIEDIPSLDLDFFMFKWLTLGLLGFMALAGVINITMFYFLRKQKIYYKNIIDSSTNMVIINDKKNIIDVNRIFFKYFYQHKTIDEFQEDYECICDLFVKEDGYLQKEVDKLYWIDYLISHKDNKHKVKIKYESEIYYFLVSTSLVSEEKSYYSVVFTDITNEEKYKIDLEKLTITDTLTGIGNRRYFHDKLLEERARADRYEHELSFIMLDIDHFKNVNDNYGHGVGDSVLVEYTKLISSMIRDGDTFCRIGGEEFIIMLPHATKDNAAELAEKLRISIENHKKVLPITMSFGVVEYIKGEEAEFILKRVDEALYEAKDAGRNRVVVR